MSHSPETLIKERELIAQIRKGQVDSWGGLYDLYAPRLHRGILMPRLCQSAAADDALSETFRTAIEKFDSFVDRGGGIFPWLARIAHNKAMDLHRAQRFSGRRLEDLSRLLTPLGMSQEGAEDLLVEMNTQRDLRTQLVASLEELNPRYRLAIQLRFLEEHDRNRCADLLEVKVGTFDVLLLRALRALRGAWDKHSPPSSRRGP